MKYNSFAADAATFARTMSFEFEGTKPAGNVIGFFEALRIEPQLRWNIWTSSEYLTLSLLVENPKNSMYEDSIDAIFRNEETDREIVAAGTNHEPNLILPERPDIRSVKELISTFKRENPNYAGTDGKSALERIVFGYGWAAERSYFYNSVAHAEGADTYLAPLRDAFCESCCRIDLPSQVNYLINTLKANSQESLVAILEPTGQARFVMRLPFFTAYLISQVANPQECIELAISMRNKAEFSECRDILQNLHNLTQAERIKYSNSIIIYLEQSLTAMMNKYCVSTQNGPQFSVSIGLSGIGIDIGTTLGKLFRPYRNRPFSRVFRNIAHDMVNVEQLGTLYEKLCSSIQKHPKATHSSVSKAPKFVERKSGQHGRPAKL